MIGELGKRDEEHILRKVLRTLNGYARERKRGRPKTRWKDEFQLDTKSTGLRAGEETDRAMWRRNIISHTVILLPATLQDGKRRRRKM